MADEHDYDVNDTVVNYFKQMKNNGLHEECIKCIVEYAASNYETAAFLYATPIVDLMIDIDKESPTVIDGTLPQWLNDHGFRVHIQKVMGLVRNGHRVPLKWIPLSQVVREDVSWLWQPYVPYNKVTLMEGDPGAGKTYLLLTICAAVTQGFFLPDQDGRVKPVDPTRAGNVLYITAEDGLGDTISPRAAALGANLDRLIVLEDATAFSLTNPQPLHDAIAEYQARLVVIDPLTAFLGTEMDMNRTNEVRPFMQALGMMASEHKCAMLASRHWTKATGGRAKYRGQGNIDFFAAARSVLVVGESPEEDSLRIVAQSKNSLGAYGRSLVFQIRDDGLFWAGTSELTADDLSQMQPNKRQHQRQTAMEWLKDYLHDGPQLASAIMEAAKAVGIPEKTLRRAKEHLRILSSKERELWYWRLPKYGPWDRYSGMEDNEGMEI